MVKLICSIECHRAISDQIFGNLFKEELQDGYTLHRFLYKIHDSLEVYAVDRSVKYKTPRSSYYSPPSMPPFNVAISLVDMDSLDDGIKKGEGNSALERYEKLLREKLNDVDRFGNDKTPVIIIGYSKKQSPPEIEINYEEIAIEKNRFLYALPTVLLSESVKKKLDNADPDLDNREKRDLEHDIIPNLYVAFKIGILLSPIFDLKNHDEEFSQFLRQILLEKYPSTGKHTAKSSINESTEMKDLLNKDGNTSVAHLVARMNVGWGVNRLIDNFSEDDIFEITMKKDEPWGQTALMEGAILSRDATLTTFLTFYATSINMMELHGIREIKKGEIKKVYKETENTMKMKDRLERLLHSKDRQQKTLVYYITHAEEKCLGPYGMIMQFEKNLHLKPSENIDKGYIELNHCLKERLGSSKDTCKAVQLMNGTKGSTTTTILALLCRIIISVLILPMSLYIADLITDAFVANTYYEEQKKENDTQDFCTQDSFSPSKITLEDYPTCLSEWKFYYTVLFPIFLLTSCLVVIKYK